MGTRVGENEGMGLDRESEASAPGGLDVATNGGQRAEAMRAAIKKVCGGGC